MSLKSIVQTLTGRRLSPTRMSQLRDKIGVEDPFSSDPSSFHALSLGKSMVDTRDVYLGEGGKGLVVHDRTFVYVSATDYLRPHRRYAGWYVERRCVQTFTDEGLLAERFMEDNFGNGFMKKTTYATPGSFTGKTERWPE